MRLPPLRPAAIAALAAIAAVLAPGAVRAQPLWLEREPQVWSPTDTSLVIGFRGNRDAVGSVEWGPTPALGHVIQGPKTRNHFLRIAGLDPDRFYWYRVRVGGAPWTRVYRTRTFPRDGADVSFFVFGDSGAFTPMQFAVRDLVAGYTFDLGLLPGDIVYPDGAREHFNWRFFWPYAPILRTTPFFPVVGNHDMQTGAGAAFYRYFWLPTRSSGTERYYSFDHGAVHFVGLDSEGSSLDAQAAWLRRDVARARARGARWVFVYHHRPAYSSGQHGRSRSIHAAWSRLFEELEIDAVFTGHDHDYQRSKTVRDFFPAKRGVVYFVVGSGGQFPRPIGPRQAYTAFAAATNGFLRVEVHGDVMRAEFIDASMPRRGKVIDRVVLAKGPVTAALRQTTPHPAPGQSLGFALDGPSGATYGVLLSDRPAHVPLGALGTVHLDPARAVLARAGRLSGSRTVRLSLSIPNDASLRGTDLLLQGYLAAGAGRLRLTDVLVSAVR